MSLNRNLLRIGGLIGFYFLPLAGVLYAQGLSSLVGGAAASPTSIGPQSAFWNPAILGVLSEKTQVEIQAGVMGGWLAYDRAGEDPNTSAGFSTSLTKSQGPNMFIAAVTPFGTEHFRFSYATYFPSGLMAEFDETGSQRYDLINGMLIPWHHQFTVAYRPNPRWSFALAGITSIGIFETELDVDLGKMMQKILQQEDQVSEHPALSARAQIPRTIATAFGAIAGVYYRPSARWSFGLSATTPISYRFNGKFRIRPPQFSSVLGPAMPALGIEDPMESSMQARTTMPACIQAGFRFNPKGYWTQDYFGRYILSGFIKSLSISVKDSAIEQLRNVQVPGQELDDSYLFGMTHTFSLYNEWTLGLLASYYFNGVPDENISVSRVDFNSLTLGGFLKFHLTQRWSLGAEYAHTFLFSRQVKTSAPAESNSEFFQPPSSAGEYRAAIDRASLVLKYAF